MTSASKQLETQSSSGEEEDQGQSPEQGKSDFRPEGDARRRKISNHSKGIHRQPLKITRIRKKKDEKESPP